MEMDVFQYVSNYVPEFRHENFKTGCILFNYIIIGIFHSESRQAIDTQWCAKMWALLDKNTNNIEVNRRKPDL